MWKSPALRAYSGKIHRFKQHAPTVTIAYPGAGVSQQLAYSYTLNDLDQVTTFTALFDQYRIRKIQVTFRPAYNMAMLQTSPFSGATTYNYHVIDQDDATALTDAQLRQYDTCQVHTNVQQFTRTFTPRIASAAYSGAFSSFANLSSNTWIDVASPSVQYYGTKFNQEASPSGGTQPIGFLDNVYYIEFRATR